MTVERLILFQWPEAYVKHCSQRLVRVTSGAIWLAGFSLASLVRYGFCYLRNHSTEVFTKIGYCNQIMMVYYTCIVIFVLTISSASYWKIFAIVKSKQTVGMANFQSTLAQIRKYRSTSLVLVYIIVIYMTSIAYLAIGIVDKVFRIDPSALRLALDTVNIINCMLDPYLYAYWFRESKMVCFNILAVVNKKYQVSAERLRVEIYDIVTNELTRKSRRVYPQTSVEKFNF